MQYGLKQTSRQWNIELTKFLVSYGFSQFKHDHSLFTVASDNTFIITLVYVDDILLIGNSVTAIQQVKSALHVNFTIKDLGATSYFLGMELCRKKIGILLNQCKYILDILQTFDVNNLPVPATPLHVGLKLDIFLVLFSQMHLHKGK